MDGANRGEVVISSMQDCGGVLEKDWMADQGGRKWGSTTKWAGRDIWGHDVHLYPVTGLSNHLRNTS